MSNGKVLPAATPRDATPPITASYCVSPYDTPYFWLGRDAETWLD